MKTKRLIMVIVAFLMVLSLACNAGRTTTTPAPTEVPPTKTEPTKTPTTEPTARPTATPAPTKTPAPADTAAPTATEEEGATIEIINNSGTDIWYVYISPTDSEDWGDDWLGGDVIPAGESYVLTDIPAGTYDLQVEDENGNAIETMWETEVTGDNTWTVEATQVSLEVVNGSEELVAALYVSPSDSDEWGKDWLGGVAIKSGGSYVVEGLDVGTYDIKAENADGETVESIFNVDLSGEYSWNIVGKADLPANAVLRFEDDFSDNRNNWGAIAETDDVYYMKPEDGQYCILIKSSELTAWEWYEPFRPAEFVAEVACTRDADTDASCGIGFGPDGDNLYWFEVSPADQTFALFLLQDDEWQDPPIGWTESKNIVPNGWNYLSIERVGGYFTVFVNGVMLGQVESDIFPTGRIGIGGATYDDDNVTVCLDDLRVWRIEK
ncbi:MAG TPA: hypothetical protein PLH19_05375 [Anaerolineae bacterium]|nr:hypothetical protein [Anaerolineae bacterium]HQH37952.1 hypothetical protein [Anaerolineae bacterium]